METTCLDISEARAQFTRLDERLRRDRVIWITRRNKKAFAVVDTEVLEAVLETIEILSDPEACQLLQQGLQDVRAGRLFDHEDVRSELFDDEEKVPRKRPVDRRRKGSHEKASSKRSPRSV